MRPQRIQQKTLKESSLTCSSSYEFCESCSCQRCRNIQSTGRCSNCQCDDCADVLPSHNYHSGSTDEGSAPQEDNTAEFVTPKKRITGRSLSAKEKKAVKDAAHAAVPELQFANASLGFCLVSLMTDIADTLQTCHIIPKGTAGKNDHLMMQLEYSWGMEYNELNLNSRYNMMNLEASLHLSFDRGHWALLPLDDIYITKFTSMRFTVENPLEAIYNENKIFRYVFLPFPSLNRPIMRLNETRVNEKTSDSNPVTVHYSPYGTLQPILKSHVKPHFVVFDLVTKLRGSGLNIRQLVKGRHHVKRSTLNDFEILYDKWMQVEVPLSFKGSKIRTNKDNDDVEENEDGKEGFTRPDPDSPARRGKSERQYCGESDMRGQRYTGDSAGNKASWSGSAGTKSRYQTRSQVKRDNKNKGADINS